MQRHGRPTLAAMSAAARLATLADVPAVESALAQAFLDDPMITWLLDEPDPAIRLTSSITGFFAAATEACRRRGHAYVLDGDDGAAAAALWSPPDVAVLSEEEALVLGGGLAAVAGDAAIERVMALGELVGRHHPEGRPHFYLFILGAAEQGRGAGSAVLQPVLERCDLDGLGAYLESSSGRNVSFYERHGFRVTWEEAPEGGPVMRGMWREPGSGRG